MKKVLGLSLVLFSSLFLSACGVKPDDNSATTTPSDQQEESVKSSFSLRDLIAKNIPQKCVWTSNVDGTQSQGTMVISGNKFKQETTIKQDGEEFVTYSISDGTYLYTWQEKAGNVSPEIAMKMKLDTFENPDKDSAPSDNPTSVGTVDFDQEYQYNCSPTVVSESDFQPPKDVEFTDYSQFLEDIQSQMPSINPEDFQ
jgi:ABC-type glycerol-3-phosphate transport system substrate-binding protein